MEKCRRSGYGQGWVRRSLLLNQNLSTVWDGAWSAITHWSMTNLLEVGLFGSSAFCSSIHWKRAFLVWSLTISVLPPGQKEQHDERRLSSRLRRPRHFHRPGEWLSTYILFLSLANHVFWGVKKGDTCFILLVENLQRTKQMFFSSN